MVTPHLAELLTFWFCGFEVSVAQPPKPPTPTPPMDFTSLELERCYGAEWEPSHRWKLCVYVCVCQARWGCLRLPIWEQTLGVKHWGAGGEDSVSLEDTAQPAQRSLEHTRTYTHTLTHTHTRMHSCVHAYTLSPSLSLSLLHTQTHCISVSSLSLSLSLYFAHSHTHTHTHTHTLSTSAALLCSPPLSSLILSKLHRGVRKAAVRGIIGKQLKQGTVVTLWGSKG